MIHNSLIQIYDALSFPRLYISRGSLRIGQIDVHIEWWCAMLYTFHCQKIYHTQRVDLVYFSVRRYLKKILRHEFLHCCHREHITVRERPHLLVVNSASAYPRKPGLFDPQNKQPLADPLRYV